MEHFQINFVTWNVGQENDLKSINYVIEKAIQTSPSVLVFSFQEIDQSSNIKNNQVTGSFNFFTNALKDKLQSNYELKFAENWANSALFLFISKLPESLVQYEFLDSFHILHPRNNLPLSKASIISVQKINGLKFAIVGNHLECYDENFVARNNEWLDVLKRTTELSPDYIFFLGDLNYRIELDRSEVLNRISNNDYKYLLQHDQLNRGKKENPSLEIFHEAEIAFPPTYKFDKNANNYDSSSLQRIPSYTDRILIATLQQNPLPRCLEYQSIDCQMSDHRPVHSLYSF